MKAYIYTIYNQKNNKEYFKFVGDKKLNHPDGLKNIFAYILKTNDDLPDDFLYLVGFLTKTKFTKTTEGSFYGTVGPEQLYIQIRYEEIPAIYSMGE